MFSVLLVDDSQIQCYAMQRVLGQLGLSVTCAEDGLGAVDLATAGSFDAVLLDIHLPDIDGFEVCRRIRHAEGIRQPAIVFYSAVNAGFAASEHDAEACLTYPVEPEHIAFVLEGAVAKRRVQQDPERKK